MKFKLWLENQLPSIFTGLRSKEEFMAFLKKSTPQEQKFILDWAESINKEEYAKKLGTSHPILLYHGSPQESIAKNGFQITKGQRSHGFLGASYDVQNHGIFMTDSKEMAHFFGSNRADNPRNYKVYEAYAKLDRLFDVTVPMPLQFRKLALKLINSYYGTKKNKIAGEDIWWLLDQSEFVDMIKSAGYDAVKFQESTSIRKQSKKDSSSYLIFNPSHLIVKSIKNDLLKDVNSIWDYIASQNHIQ